MRKNEIVRRAYHYSGVSIIVPEVMDIVPSELPLLPPVSYPNETDDFRLTRIIGNFGLFTRAHFDEKYFEDPVQEFDPPIEFRVEYTVEDLRHVNCEIQLLKLAYWDTEKWVIVSTEAYVYLIFPQSTAMVAEFKIWSWLGDPTLAWGD
jgi:hypothetical protein